MISEPQTPDTATCACRTAGPAAGVANERRLGVDDTAGRFGEVSVLTCPACAARWMRYSVRYGQGPVGETTYVCLIPPTLHPINAGAAETVMNASSSVFAWTAGPRPCNWTPLMAGRVRLGIRR